MIRNVQRFAAFAVPLSALLLCTGCMGRMIREGAGVVTGASGKAVELQPLSGRQLDQYGSISFDSLGTDMPNVPSSLPDRIRRQTLEALREKKLFGDGGPALVIRGRIIHYETGGAVDAAIGPLQEVIARVELADASGGTIGVANIIGRAKSLTAGGEGNLAEGAAKGIVEWISQHRSGSR